MPPKGTRQSVYSMEQRTAALVLVAEMGLAKAASRTGIPKSTLHDWAAVADVPTASVEAREHTEAATQASVLSRRQKIEQSRERMTMALTVIAEVAANKEIEMIRAGKASLSEVVGARTRAIHDLQLLDGQATDRTEINVSVTTEAVISLRDDLRKRLSS